jgi:hypothetical protein
MATTRTQDKKKEGRRFKGEMPEFHKLEENEDIRGVYQGYKEITIKDKEKGEKLIRVYRFRDPDDEKKKFALSGRSLLDMAFDEMFEAVGADAVIGEVLHIFRGKDSKNGANRIGNYEIELEATK